MVQNPSWATRQSNANQMTAQDSTAGTGRNGILLRIIRSTRPCPSFQSRKRICESVNLYPLPDKD